MARTVIECAAVTAMNISVFCSGNGSNLQVLIDAQRAGTLAAEIALVVSDKPGCRALERAASSGIPTFSFRPRDFPTRADYEREMGDRVDKAGCSLVVLAGFMRLFTPYFIERFAGRIINIHPSLLPAFPGAHGIRDAWDAGVKVTGCTVHVVINEVDAGPIIDQHAVAVAPGETLESLEAKIHAAEHLLLPEVVRAIATGRIELPLSSRDRRTEGSAA